MENIYDTFFFHAFCDKYIRNDIGNDPTHVLTKFNEYLKQFDRDLSLDSSILLNKKVRDIISNISLYYDMYDDRIKNNRNDALYYATEQLLQSYVDDKHELERISRSISRSDSKTSSVCIIIEIIVERILNEFDNKYYCGGTHNHLIGMYISQNQVIITNSGLGVNNHRRKNNLYQVILIKNNISKKYIKDILVATVKAQIKKLNFSVTQLYEVINGDDANVDDDYTYAEDQYSGSCTYFGTYYYLKHLLQDNFNKFEQFYKHKIINDLSKYLLDKPMLSSQDLNILDILKINGIVCIPNYQELYIQQSKQYTRIDVIDNKDDVKCILTKEEEEHDCSNLFVEMINKIKSSVNISDSIKIYCDYINACIKQKKMHMNTVHIVVASLLKKDLERKDDNFFKCDLEKVIYYVFNINLLFENEHSQSSKNHAYINPKLMKKLLASLLCRIDPTLKPLENDINSIIQYCLNKFNLLKSVIYDMVSLYNSGNSDYMYIRADLYTLKDKYNRSDLDFERKLVADSVIAAGSPYDTIQFHDLILDDETDSNYYSHYAKRNYYDYFPFYEELPEDIQQLISTITYNSSYNIFDSWDKIKQYNYIDEFKIKYGSKLQTKYFEDGKYDLLFKLLGYLVKHEQNDEQKQRFDITQYDEFIRKLEYMNFDKSYIAFLNKIAKHNRVRYFHNYTDHIRENHNLFVEKVALPYYINVIGGSKEKFELLYPALIYDIVVYYISSFLIFLFNCINIFGNIMVFNIKSDKNLLSYEAITVHSGGAGNEPIIEETKEQVIRKPIIEEKKEPVIRKPIIEEKKKPVITRTYKHIPLEYKKSNEFTVIDAIHDSIYSYGYYVSSELQMPEYQDEDIKQYLFENIDIFFDNLKKYKSIDYVLFLLYYYKYNFNEEQKDKIAKYFGNIELICDVEDYDTLIKNTYPYIILLLIDKVPVNIINLNKLLSKLQYEYIHNKMSYVYLLIDLIVDKYPDVFTVVDDKLLNTNELQLLQKNKINFTISHIIDEIIYIEYNKQTFQLLVGYICNIPLFNGKFVFVKKDDVIVGIPVSDIKYEITIINEQVSKNGYKLINSKSTIFKYFDYDILCWEKETEKVYEFPHIYLSIKYVNEKYYYGGYEIVSIENYHIFNQFVFDIRNSLLLKDGSTFKILLYTPFTDNEKKMLINCVWSSYKSNIYPESDSIFKLIDIHYTGLFLLFEDMDIANLYLLKCIAYNKTHIIKILITQMKYHDNRFMNSLSENNNFGSPFNYYFKSKLLGLSHEYSRRKEYFGKFMISEQKYDVKTQTIEFKKLEQVKEDLGKYIITSENEINQTWSDSIKDFIRNLKKCIVYDTNKCDTVLSECDTNINYDELYDYDSVDLQTILLNNITKIYGVIEKKIIIDMMVKMDECTCTELLDIFKNIYFDKLYLGERNATIIKFEIIFGNLIRVDQKSLFDYIVGNKNNIYQMLMGKGKSAVITPLLLLHYQNLFNNVYFVVPSHLVEQTYNIVVSFAIFINYSIKRFNIDRDQNPVIGDNNIIVMDDVSIKTMRLNMLTSNEKFDLLDSIVIFDEIDDMMDSIKSDLNFPLSEYEKIDEQDKIETFILRVIGNMFFEEEKIDTNDPNFKIQYYFENVMMTLKDALTKMYKKDYGFGDVTNNPKNYKLAIPYKSSFQPCNGSEFSDTILTMILTTLSYYYSGLNTADIIGLKDLFCSHINLFGIKSFEFVYNELVKLIYPQNISDILTSSNFVELFNELLQNIQIKKKLITIYLKEIVFKKYVYVSKTRFNTSLLEVLLPNFTKRKIGYSGTVNMDIPVFDTPIIGELKVDEESNTAMIVALLGLINKYNIYKTNEIVKLFLEGGYDVLIDNGAYLKDIDVKEIAEIIFRQYPECTIYYITRDDKVKTLGNGKKIKIYYDHKHTIGIDIKQPATLRGLVTINYFNRLTDTYQAIYRLRNLNYGHIIDYVSELDIDNLFNFLQENEIKHRRLISRLFKLQNIKMIQRYDNESKFMEKLFNNVPSHESQRYVDIYLKFIENEFIIEQENIKQLYGEFKQLFDAKQITFDTQIQREQNYEISAEKTQEISHSRYISGTNGLLFVYDVVVENHMYFVYKYYILPEHPDTIIKKCGLHFSSNDYTEHIISYYKGENVNMEYIDSDLKQYLYEHKPDNVDNFIDLCKLNNIYLSPQFLVKICSYSTIFGYLYYIERDDGTILFLTDIEMFEIYKYLKHNGKANRIFNSMGCQIYPKLKNSGGDMFYVSLLSGIKSINIYIQLLKTLNEPKFKLLELFGQYFENKRNYNRFNKLLLNLLKENNYNISAVIKILSVDVKLPSYFDINSTDVSVVGRLKNLLIIEQTGGSRKVYGKRYLKK